MPYIEKQQQEAGMVVDMLDPPTDPLRASYRRNDTLWQPSPTPAPSASSLAPGIVLLRIEFVCMFSAISLNLCMYVCMYVCESVTTCLC
jgi:hypothetical protein